ncbi:MAG: hypothetical protein GY754_19325 [bacterium]|nr:hypothetical protein [bacterium]
MKKIVLICLLLTMISVSLSAIVESTDEWAMRALNIQAGVDNDAPLSETTWAGTHNSYANADDDNFLDLNQGMSLTDQLNSGIRELVFDVYYSGDAIFNIGKALRMCHGTCEKNVSGWRKLKYGLNDIRQWLENGNPDQVVILKLELGSSAKKKLNKVEDKIEDCIGDYVYRTTNVSNYGELGNNNCTELPSGSLTKSKILSAGKNIIVLYTGSCLGDGGLNKNIFYGGSSVDDVSSVNDLESLSSAYKNTTLMRTKDAATKQGTFGSDSVKMKPGNVADFMNAGLNIFEVYGFNADGSDWKKEGEYPVGAVDLVWSWDQAGYEPNGTGDYAMVKSDTGRFRDALGSETMHAACRRLVNADGSRAYADWKITGTRVTVAEAENSCISEFNGEYFFAAPRNKIELDSLAAARNEAGFSDEDIWINYTYESGSWKADIGEADEDVESYCNSGGNASICDYLDEYLDLVQ